MLVSTSLRVQSSTRKSSSLQKRVSSHRAHLHFWPSGYNFRSSHDPLRFNNWLEWLRGLTKNAILTWFQFCFQEYISGTANGTNARARYGQVPGVKFPWPVSGEYRLTTLLHINVFTNQKPHPVLSIQCLDQNLITQTQLIRSWSHARTKHLDPLLSPQVCLAQFQTFNHMLGLSGDPIAILKLSRESPRIFLLA